jgi:hypothetical protein
LAIYVCARLLSSAPAAIPVGCVHVDPTQDGAEVVNTVGSRTQGLGAHLEPQLGPLSAAYVLFLAVLGPILARAVK